MKIPIDGFVFDLDGTVYLGEQALPGAVETLAELRRRGKRVVFISNKPLEPGHVYAEKLTRLGIPTSPAEVITSARVLGQALASDFPGLRCYVVGEAALKSELRSYGIEVIPETSQDPRQVIDPAGIDAVIVAFDRTLDYRKLNTAYQALVRGARFFATNADRTCPIPGGAIPDAGGTLAALEHMTGCRPDLVGGKPSPLMLRIAGELLQHPPQRCLLAGDRLETDMRMAQQAGFTSALVLSGVTRREHLAGLQQPPDLVLETIGELLDFVE